MEILIICGVKFIWNEQLRHYLLLILDITVILFPQISLIVSAHISFNLWIAYSKEFNATNHPTMAIWQNYIGVTLQSVSKMKSRGHVYLFSTGNGLVFASA
jgi:hypothetical protein